MFSVTVGDYMLRCSPDGLADYMLYRDRAQLVEEFDLKDPEGAVCFLNVQKHDNAPFLVVAQRYSPAGGGFDPGIALVPETHILFLGAGRRLLAYDLTTPRRLWEDTCNMGFWCWTRHGDYIVMLSELEMAAWDIHARKLWTRFVEPPWFYTVSNGMVHLDIMGQKSLFSLATGPD
jgi:hypothetical protein